MLDQCCHFSHWLQLSFEKFNISSASESPPMVDLSVSVVFKAGGYRSTRRVAMGVVLTHARVSALWSVCGICRVAAIYNITHGGIISLDNVVATAFLSCHFLVMYDSMEPFQSSAQQDEDNCFLLIGFAEKKIGASALPPLGNLMPSLQLKSFHPFREVLMSQRQSPRHHRLHRMPPVVEHAFLRECFNCTLIFCDVRSAIITLQFVDVSFFFLRRSSR